MYYIFVFYGEMLVFIGLFYVYQCFFKSTEMGAVRLYHMTVLIESSSSKISDEGMISH